MVHREIEALLKQSGEYTEYRQACNAVSMPLSAEIQAALGTPTRRITPFLGVVVDVIANKLEIDNDSIVGSKVADTRAFQRWLGDDWSITERELYAAVVRDGTAYVLVTPELQYIVRESYNGVNGAKHCGDFAFNTWQEGNDNYLDLYYPDKIEKYSKSRENDKAEWKPRTDAPDEPWPLPWVNETGEPLGIAIIEFNIGSSDIADAIQIAKDMNEALLDMLATSRSQGWPQRFLKGEKNADVITSALGQPVVNNAGNPIKRTVRTAPGSIMILGATAELQQLPATAVDTALLDKLLELLSFVTTVPSHYFTGQWPSGISLITAESRLNSKIENHQGRLSTAIVAMLRLSMRLSNYFDGTAFNVDQPLNIPWHSPEIETEDLRQTRQAFQQDSLVKLVEGGLLSKEAAVRELHRDWDEQQILEELGRLGISSLSNLHQE